jgi:hypothetical protein
MSVNLLSSLPVGTASSHSANLAVFQLFEMFTTVLTVQLF